MKKKTIEGDDVFERREGDEEKKIKRLNRSRFLPLSLVRFLSFSRTRITALLLSTPTRRVETKRDNPSRKTLH